jgi:hypothetical protein
MRTSRTIAAVVLTIALAAPALATRNRDTHDSGPLDRIVRIIKKVFAPVKTMEQPIIPIPTTTTT